MISAAPKADYAGDNGSSTQQTRWAAVGRLAAQRADLALPCTAATSISPPRAGTGGCAFAATVAPCRVQLAGVRLRPFGRGVDAPALKLPVCAPDFSCNPCVFHHSPGCPSQVSAVGRHRVAAVDSDLLHPRPFDVCWQPTASPSSTLSPQPGRSAFSSFRSFIFLSYLASAKPQLLSILHQSSPRTQSLDFHHFIFRLYHSQDQSFRRILFDRAVRTPVF
jgi:hypothetical protein